MPGATRAGVHSLFRWHREGALCFSPCWSPCPVLRSTILLLSSGYVLTDRPNPIQLSWGRHNDRVQWDHKLLPAEPISGKAPQRESGTQKTLETVVCPGNEQQGKFIQFIFHIRKVRRHSSLGENHRRRNFSRCRVPERPEQWETKNA